MLLLAGGCGSGTTSVGNPNVINIGKVENNATTVTIPLDSLGIRESDLAGVTISVLKNLDPFSEVSAVAKFDPEKNAIIFQVSPVIIGDNISLTIKGLPQGEVVYSSVLSDQEQKQATLDCKNSTNEAVLLACASCDAIIECEPSVQQANCLSHLIQSFQLADEFSVPVPENSISFQSVVDGVEDKTYVADQAQFNQCLLDLEALSCADISTGYSINDPDNFEGVENFIPGDDGTGACGLVFGTP